MVRKIGQITIKKIGHKYAACISGTPQKLFTSFKQADEEVERLRRKYGRRYYGYQSHKKK